MTRHTEAHCVSCEMSRVQSHATKWLENLGSEDELGVFGWRSQCFEAVENGACWFAASSENRFMIAEALQ